MSNNDNLRGTGRDLGGKVKEGVGDLTDDKSLEREGQSDQLRGKADKAMGDVKSTVKQAGENIKDALDNDNTNSSTTDRTDRR